MAPPTTNAERCKRYRESHKEKYRENDALRKRHSRLIATLDPVRNAARKEKERLRKKAYRQRQKHIKRMAVEEKNAADVATPETSSSASTPSSAFKHKATKARSMRRAMTALPNSPAKRNEIIGTLALKFQLKVQLQAKTNRGRKKEALSDDQRKWLLEFLDRADISYITPGKSDHVYVGKINGERQYAQKRYLLWNLRDLFEIINGNQLNTDVETFVTKFGERLRFSQLYELIKCHKEYVFNKSIPQSTCLCEICENTVFLMKGLNKSIKKQEKMLPMNPHDIVERFSCDSGFKECMATECPKCATTDLSPDDFSVDDSESHDSSTGESNDSHTNEVSFYEWCRDDGKIKKALVTVAVSDAIDRVNNQVESLKQHIYVKRQQVKCYNEIKENLEEDEILLHVDYSENYENKQQGEIQSAYFGHTTFSLFTACCYLRLPNEDDLHKDHLTITSESTDHSRIAAFTCVQKVLDHLRRKYAHLQRSLRVHIWSDGCAAQFRSRYVFSLMTHFDSSYQLIWYYNERHRGKGPMDGIGGTVKNLVFRHVKSGKCVINSPREFAEYSQQIVTGITSLYMPESEVGEEPADVMNAPKIATTLQVHKVERLYNKDQVCLLRFYQTASDAALFHTQWYRRAHDPEVCGHLDQNLGDNHCNHCSAAYARDDGFEWLCCPICERWFHEECFHL